MIHEVTYYQAKCDRCGYIETDYGDYAAYSVPEGAIEEVLDGEWMRVGDDGLACPDCWTLDDDETVVFKPKDDAP